MIGIQS